MNVKDKNEYGYEYVYLEIPIIPPTTKKSEDKEQSSVVIIDFNSNNDSNVIDFDILK